MDGERIKPTVYVMGERGAKVRFNALNPAGDDVAADLACNGSDFQYVDFNRDCQLTGPCTKDAISQLLRISLRPDDFLLLAIGSTPLVENASGKVVWDSKNKQEKLTLVSGDGSWKQEIRLDGREQRWDVLSSTVWNADGDIEWKITNSSPATMNVLILTPRGGKSSFKLDDGDSFTSTFKRGGKVTVSAAADAKGTTPLLGEFTLVSGTAYAS